MDAQFLAELNERLFVHFADQQWRAPLGARLLSVNAYDNGRVGQIVCAGTDDIVRAFEGLRSSDPFNETTFLSVLDKLRDKWTALRKLEAASHSSALPAVSEIVKAGNPGQGPTALLSAADLSFDALRAALLDGVQRGGLVWKPAPNAAGSAHLLMSHLAPLSAGRLALVQGDHASGEMLAREARARNGEVLWASRMPMPQSLAPQS